MAAIRVTQKILVQRSHQSLQRQLNRLMVLQQQVATGLKVNSPAEGPIETRRAIVARSNVDRNDQYLSNLTAISPFLTESVTSLQTALSAMQRTYELALQGASGTYAQLQLDEIAMEVNQLLETTVEAANRKVAGRFAFGGTRTMAEPFEVTRDPVTQEITGVAYVGNQEHIEVPVGDNIKLSINLAGDEAFMNSQDIFQTIIDLRDNLRAGDQASIQDLRIQELLDAQDQFLRGIARVGAVENRVDNLTSELEAFNIELEKVKSDMLDVDFAETMVDMNAQMNAYQAALNVTARALQPNLLQYLQ